MKTLPHHFTSRQLKVLQHLGENIRLARLRRKISLRSMSERAGISLSTVSSIELGSPSVSIGNYLLVLSVCNLENDIGTIALHDPLGRQLQDSVLTSRKRVSKRKQTPLPNAHAVAGDNPVNPVFD